MLEESFLLDVHEVEECFLLDGSSSVEVEESSILDGSIVPFNFKQKKNIGDNWLVRKLLSDKDENGKELL